MECNKVFCTELSWSSTWRDYMWWRHGLSSTHKPDGSFFTFSTLLWYVYFTRCLDRQFLCWQNSTETELLYPRTCAQDNKGKEVYHFLAVLAGNILGLIGFQISLMSSEICGSVTYGHVQSLPTPIIHLHGRGKFGIEIRYIHVQKLGPCSQLQRENSEVSFPKASWTRDRAHTCLHDTVAYR